MLPAFNKKVKGESYFRDVLLDYEFLACHANGHHRGPVTLAPFAKRLAVELSLPVFRLN